MLVHREASFERHYAGERDHTIGFVRRLSQRADDAGSPENVIVDQSDSYLKRFEAIS